MLVIVDMQNDFLDQEKGIMAVKGADGLANGILKKIKEYEQKQDLIVYTLNIHEKMIEDNRKDEEIKWGQEVYHPLKKNLEKHLPMQKTHHAIDPKIAEEFKNKYEDNRKYVREIEMVGVETNVCVLSNAVIFRNMFPSSEIIINKRLCLSSDPVLHEKALDIMKSLNMKVRN